jgi:hypothetical protein
MEYGGLVFEVVHFYSGDSFPGQYLNLHPEQAYTQAGNGLR